MHTREQVARTLNVGDIMAKIAANGQFIEETIGNEAWRCDSCGTSLDNWCGCDTRLEDVEDDLENVIEELTYETKVEQYQALKRIKDLAMHGAARELNRNKRRKVMDNICDDMDTILDALGLDEDFRGKYATSQISIDN